MAEYINATNDPELFKTSRQNGKKSLPTWMTEHALNGMVRIYSIYGRVIDFKEISAIQFSQGYLNGMILI